MAIPKLPTSIRPGAWISVSTASKCFGADRRTLADLMRGQGFEPEPGQNGADLFRLSDVCRVKALCAYLADDADSPLKRHTPEGRDVDAIIDLRAVFQNYHRDIEVDSLHWLLVPQKGSLSLRDYEKVFCPDLKSGKDIFDMRGIDRDRGCIVVVRPDHYVANVLPIDAFDELTRFFAGVLKTI